MNETLRKLAQIEQHANISRVSERYGHISTLDATP